MATIVSVTSKLRRDRARRLRRDQTEAEAKLWEVLRAGRLEGWKWRRQSPVGPFIVDFLCLEASLVVELDGGIHAERTEYDARRDAYLKRLGLQVIRFANREVFDARDHVAWKILSACRESDPSRRATHIPRGRRPKSQHLRRVPLPSAAALWERQQRAASGSQLRATKRPFVWFAWFVDEKIAAKTDLRPILS